MELDKIWEQGLRAIEVKVGVGVYDLWFKPMKLFQLKAGEGIIEVPNRFYREWIDDNHPTLIAETLSKILEKPVRIKYKVLERDTRAGREADSQMEMRRVQLAERGIFLNPKYTFDTFVVGSCNQFATAAAKAAVEALGKTYNPLFIYSGTGLGKTHLLNAMGNYVIDQSSKVRLLYIPAEQFTNEVIHAIRNDRMAEFRGKYRKLDLLLIDDIQIIAGKDRTQEEFFHTFNALYEDQKQVVISSDRLPKDLSPITERLKSRFAMGLTADLQPPDTETKVAIIWKKAESERIHIPEDVAFFLASKVKTSIRELEGCLIRLGAYASLVSEEISLDMAKRILKDFLHDEEKPVIIEDIQKAVCEYYGIKIPDIKAKRRTKEVVFPRQVAMYLSKMMTRHSLSEIGKYFGGRDHATVIHAYKLIEDRIKTEETFNKTMEQLIRKIKP